MLKPPEEHTTGSDEVPLGPLGLVACCVGVEVPAAMYRREVSVCVDGRQRTQQAAGLPAIGGECSLPPATGEHCLLAMPLRERVRPVVSGDAKPTEPQSGAMAAAPEGVKSGQISAQGPLF